MIHRLTSGTLMSDRSTRRHTKTRGGANVQRKMLIVNAAVLVTWRRRRSKTDLRRRLQPASTRWMHRRSFDVPFPTQSGALSGGGSISSAVLTSVLYHHRVPYSVATSPLGPVAACDVSRTLPAEPVTLLPCVELQMIRRLVIIYNQRPALNASL